MQKPIRIALCDDHLLIRQALKVFIQNQPEFEVVIDADFAELTQLLKRSVMEVDVLLIDFDCMDVNHFSILKIAIEKNPHAGIVVVSLHHDSRDVTQLFQNGINAFVSKADDKDDLIAALQLASRKEKFSNKFYKMTQEKKYPSQLPSKVEMEIFKLLWEDKSNKEIAETLCMSLSMLEKVKHALKTKTDARSNLGLIKYALDNGILFNRK